MAEHSELSRQDWDAFAAQVLADTPADLFIGGEYRPAIEGGRFESMNPADDSVLAEVASGTAADVDHAVIAARSAYRGGEWRLMEPRERMAVMYRWSELVVEHSRELAVLETLDMGKPISDALEVDLPSVADFIRFCGECIDKIDGRVTSTRHDVLHLVRREPLGVVGAISPWNYPLLMATWKVAPALAAGNSVVLKPAEQAPLSCLRLAELFLHAGGPAGVFNVVNGIGEVAGRALAMHADVDKVSFTGSTAVGKLMLQYAGQSNMKRVALETGGKSPQVFLSDLADLERAIEAGINGIFSNQGEVCNAGSRLIVERAIYDDFVALFVERGRDEFVVGNPLDPDVMMGPLVSREAQGRVLGYIEAGREEGASLRFGGGVPAGMEGGAYVEPTLFADVDNAMTIAREEIFGPVAAIIPVADEAEALAVANDTSYGLAASVWTSDLGKAHRFFRDLEAGVIWVNTFDDGDMTQPFGGYKQSGNAKDNCIDSVLSYTQEKSGWFVIGG
jgi:gamma-glutamyl-gamma-aminobutyraldehyde dehydrogenase